MVRRERLEHVFPVPDNDNLAAVSLPIGGSAPVVIYFLFDTACFAVFP
jgi:hypothetical protein